MRSDVLVSTRGARTVASITSYVVTRAAADIRSTERAFTDCSCSAARGTATHTPRLHTHPPTASFCSLGATSSGLAVHKGQGVVSTYFITRNMLSRLANYRLRCSSYLELDISRKDFLPCMSSHFVERKCHGSDMVMKMLHWRTERIGR
jgi:hypothetical protein